MSIWLANLLSEFTMFEKEYSFKSLLFTRSASCITFARSLQIDVVEQFPEDRRGNPFLFNMLAVAKRRYSAHFYGSVEIGPRREERRLHTELLRNRDQVVRSPDQRCFSKHAFEGVVR